MNAVTVRTRSYSVIEMARSGQLETASTTFSSKEGGTPPSIAWL